MITTKPTRVTENDFFKEDKLSALEAKEYAQLLAFAPIAFQATRILRDSGILEAVKAARKNGITISEVAEKVKMPVYGTRVLMEAGLGIGLLLLNDEKYTITKTGFFILTDDLTKVNMNFTHDVCYKAMFELESSIKTGKPTGLKVFGDWNTLYEGLSILPEKEKRSWFEFDHYYSDHSFPEVLEKIFSNAPKKILDIGGNTGKWAIQCLKHSPTVEVCLVDLPGQLKMAEENITKAGFTERIAFKHVNMLDVSQKLPKGFDLIWMSQFLDCFSEIEITNILKKCYEAIEENGVVYIMELFWDRQPFKASAFSLQMTSLYFTNIANGNSQMYDSNHFIKCIENANFEVVELTDNVGLCHTLLKCKKRS